MGELENYAKIQITIVCAIITNDRGEVFLIRRNDPGTTEHEKLEFPGGKIEFGEDPLQAVVREAKEETGFEVEVMRLLPKVETSVYPQNEIYESRLQVFILSYQCKVVGGEFKPKDEEVLGGQFYKPAEINYSECLAKTKEIIDLLNLN